MTTPNQSNEKLAQRVIIDFDKSGEDCMSNRLIGYGAMRMAELKDTQYAELAAENECLCSEIDEICTKRIEDHAEIKALDDQLKLLNKSLEEERIYYSGAIQKLEAEKQRLEQRVAELEADKQPKLTVGVYSFPESNGKRNWTALIRRAEKWGGLVGNCGGVMVEYGEYWNRVAYMAERAKFLIGERDTEPHILDYGTDMETPDQWEGEKRSTKRIAQERV